MARNQILGLDLVRLAQIWAHKVFFRGFYFYYMLQFVPSYHRMQFQGKRMI